MTLEPTNLRRYGLLGKLARRHSCRNLLSAIAEAYCNRMGWDTLCAGDDFSNAHCLPLTLANPYTFTLLAMPHIIRRRSP